MIHWLREVITENNTGKHPFTSYITDYWIKHVLVDLCFLLCSLTTYYEFCIIYFFTSSFYDILFISDVESTSSTISRKY